MYSILCDRRKEIRQRPTKGISSTAEILEILTPSCKAVFQQITFNRLAGDRGIM
jgi:hypothetical protein